MPYRCARLSKIVRCLCQPYLPKGVNELNSNLCMELSPFALVPPKFWWRPPTSVMYLWPLVSTSVHKNSQKRKSYDSHVISIIMPSFFDLVCLYTPVKCIFILPAYLTTLLLSAAERRSTPVLLSASVSDNSGNSPQVAAPRRPRQIDQSRQRFHVS